MTSVTRRNRWLPRIATLAAFGFLLFRLLGCLDADPLGPGSGAARLQVDVSYLPGEGARKTAAPDSLRILLYDVTGDLYTDEPEGHALAASQSSYLTHEDATGRYFLGELLVDLLEEREFRVVARLSYDGDAGRELVAGQRTIVLGPGDRRSLAMVMTGAAAPLPGDYGLAIARSTAPRGAGRHAIPVVLRNGDPIGGLQFQVRFDEAALDSVLGIEVDPSSRLYAGSGGDSLIGSHYAQPTDSTLRVVTVDLSPVEGDSIGGSLRPIPAGNDVVFFLLVDVAESFPLLPDTVRLTLDDVFFSTPSGSTDVVVTDTTNGLLIVTN
jgi:hypothetical protein